jgi:hypothetical protein
MESYQVIFIPSVIDKYLLGTGLDYRESADAVATLVEYDYLTRGSRYQAFASSLLRDYAAQAPNFNLSDLNSETAYALSLATLHPALMQSVDGE